MSDRSPSPKDNADESRRSRSPSPRGESPRRERSRSPAARNEESASESRNDNGELSNPGNNVYVANLPLRMTEAEVEQEFSKFGRIQKCEVILDPATRESRGFAFVTYEDVRDAEDAVKEMSGKEIQGRRLRVEIAKRKRGHEKTPGKYLGPRLASSKYGREGRRDSRDRGGFRDRSRDRGRRSRSRSRDRSSRRHDDRDRRYDDRRGGRRSYDRYDDRRSRR